jgi:hypothetical protein
MQVPCYVVDERNTALMNSVDWLIAEIKDGCASQQDVQQLMVVTPGVSKSFILTNFVDIGYVTSFVL